MKTEEFVGGKKCAVIFKSIQNMHMEPATGALWSAIKCILNFPYATSLHT
jgi:hypothetical protein